MDHNGKMWISRLLISLAMAGLIPTSSPAESPRLDELVDIDGVSHGSLGASAKRANILYFVMRDCPISNQYAPEIGRICSDYQDKRVGCFLIYVDPDATEADIREHRKNYDLACCPAIRDRRHRMVGQAGATVTPEAAVFSEKGRLLYRGRINDFYAALGKPRRKVRVHDLRKALDEVLADVLVSTPFTQAIGCYIPPSDF